MKTYRPFSVFIVDDDKLFSAALTHQLEKIFKTKTSIRTFSTGEECLPCLTEFPDVIILDYFLNGKYLDAMNGLQVLRRIVQVSPETKVVMMSAQDKMEVAVDTIKHGAYDYIIKNDKVFLRTKLVMTNVKNAITDSQDLKSYKFWIKIASGLILLMAGACTAIQMKFPGIF